jgi:hypothetical protein
MWVQAEKHPTVASCSAYKAYARPSSRICLHYLDVVIHKGELNVDVEPVMASVPAASMKIRS